MKPTSQTILYIVLSVLFIASMYRGCEDRKQADLLHQSDIETYKIANENLQREIDSARIIKDTIYLQKTVSQTRYINQVEYVNSLDSAQNDSLFDALYESKKDANLTHYELENCKTQLSLSDSIISQDSVIISALAAQKLNSDTFASKETIRANNAEKNAKKQYRKGLLHGGVVGFAIGVMAH